MANMKNLHPLENTPKTLHVNYVRTKLPPLIRSYCLLVIVIIYEKVIYTNTSDDYII